MNNTPQNSMEERIIKEFNDFIVTWCSGDWRHLLDTDENDGERFRQKLREITTALAKERERVLGIIDRGLPPCQCGLDVLGNIYSNHNSGCEWSQKEYKVKVIKEFSATIKNKI